MTDESVRERIMLSSAALIFPFSVLLGVALVELILYRLLSSINTYASVGTGGTLARLADVGTVSLTITAAATLILLFISMLRLVHHPAIQGSWWRILLILVSPINQLVLVWSMWMSLSNTLLLAAIGTSLFTISLLVLISILRPIPGGARRLILGLLAMLFCGTAAWIAFDLLQYDPLTHIGRTARFAYHFGEGIALALPLFAWPVLCFPNTGDFISRFAKPHVPALFLATLVTAGAGLLIGWAQFRGCGVVQFLDTTEFLVRMTYRTVGLTAVLPAGPAVMLVSLFFLTLTASTLMLSFRSWKPDDATRLLGISLLLIYIAGIQPFAVYQVALSLLGFIAFLTALADRYSLATPPVTYEHFEQILQELDEEPLAKEKENGTAQPIEN